MSRESPPPELSARRFLLALLLGTLAALAVILFRLGPALALAAVLSAMISPLQKRLTRLFRGRANVAAVLIVFAVVLLILAPATWLSAFVMTELTQGARFLAETLRSDGVSGLIDRLPESTRRLVEPITSMLSGSEIDDLGEAVQKQGGKAAEAVGSVVAATGSALFQLLMMLIALYFLLTQGRQLLDWVDEVSPLRRGQTHELIAEFRKVARSIVVSTAATAGAQAAVALVGYLIARVPHPVFFTLITFFLAFIPAVGGGGVCMAAAGLMLLLGRPYLALFLALWAVLAVGLVDNLVKPLVMRGGAQMSGAVVFFSLIGGLMAFGGLGLLVGPFAAALFLALLRIYWRDFAVKPTATTRPSTPAGATG